MADFDVRSFLLNTFLACVPLAASFPASAEAADIDTLLYRIHYPKGKSEFVSNFHGNNSTLDSLRREASIIYSDSLLRAVGLQVIGASSPDGPMQLNIDLAKLRAGDIVKMLPEFGITPKVEILPISWQSVIELAEKDPKLPYRDKTLEALGNLAEGDAEDPVLLKKLRFLCYGVPYKYLANNIFPKLRYTEILLAVSRDEPHPVPVVKAEKEPETIQGPTEREETVDEETTVEAIIPEEKRSKPFLMDIRTNMLYDLAALPNIGVEFWLGGDFSVGLNWQYAWWSKDKRHRFWRGYGGDINARWWFGKVADAKPLSGHHLGVYGQMLTYDVEWGGKGYMGGKPGSNLWHRMNWGAGVEYGYSLPVSKHFNIDFTAGFGYFGGRYYEYKPWDGHYVWQRTRQLNWWGPTKAEVSLVWMLGNSRERNDYKKDISLTY